MGTQYIAEEGDVRIDFSRIPAFRRIELATAAVELMEQVFASPGVEEEFQTWLGQRQKERT